MASGCTLNNSNQQEITPITPTDILSVETTQIPQTENTQITVSWKDFYPDHNEQEKSELIEKAKDEIMRLFPNVDRNTLNGVWVEHTRINKNNIEEVGCPYINFQNVGFTSGESREFKIEVDPELMKIIYYSPYKGTYSVPVISYNEAKKKAIDFVKNAQGEDSIVNDPEAYVIMKNEYELGGRTTADISYYETYGGVRYLNNGASVYFDMSRDKVEIYLDNIANPKLLAGMTTLSAEPDISFEEAVQIFEDKLAKQNDIGELELEYSTINPYETNLFWLDYDNIVYADDPIPIPLVWYVGYSDKESREYGIESGMEQSFRGVFIIDAHTGDILQMIDGNINIKKWMNLV